MSRLVELATVNGVTQFPDDESLFFNSFRDGAQLVATYTGAIPHPTIPDYVGSLVYDPITYETIMDGATFKLQLTEDEFNLFWASVDQELADAVVRLSNRNGVVDVESQSFAAVMVAAVNDAVLTQQRADELSKGIPVGG